MRPLALLSFALAAHACSADPSAPPSADLGPAPATDLAAPACPGGGCGPEGPLEVRFLGVGGYLLEAGDDVVLTAPLYTRPSMLTVTAGSARSDAALVARSLPAGALDRLRAVLSGHAHYDHLLDVPAILDGAPAATLYANTSARHLLAALAPDRVARCAGTPAPPRPLDRARVVALDDPAASRVDFRPCPGLRPDGAPAAGAWVRVPQSRVRLYAVCSAHPDQVGPYHFGARSVDQDACALPGRMADWREGRTLAFLIDFLDEADRPRYRVYYQDAPTTVPVGLPPPDVLAGKAIDLALLNVGNYDRVADHPAATIAALRPRYALGGHWEDFFRPASEPLEPLAFHDVAGWLASARAALPPDDVQILHNGRPAAERAVLPLPGDRFTLAR